MTREAIAILRLFGFSLFFGVVCWFAANLLLPDGQQGGTDSPSLVGEFERFRGFIEFLALVIGVIMGALVEMLLRLRENQRLLLDEWRAEVGKVLRHEPIRQLLPGVEHDVKEKLSSHVADLLHFIDTQALGAQCIAAPLLAYRVRDFKESLRQFSTSGVNVPNNITAELTKSLGEQISSYVIVERFPCNPESDWTRGFRDFIEQVGRDRNMVRREYVLLSKWETACCGRPGLAPLHRGAFAGVEKVEAMRAWLEARNFDAYYVNEDEALQEYTRIASSCIGIFGRRGTDSNRSVMLMAIPPGDQQGFTEQPDYNIRVYDGNDISQQLEDAIRTVQDDSWRRRIDDALIEDLRRDAAEHGGAYEGFRP